MNKQFAVGLFVGLILAPVALFAAHQLGWTGGMLSMMDGGTHRPMMGSPQAHEPALMSQRLRLALSAGDTAVVENLLDPDVVIYESGGVETGFAEYAAHHLEADMGFLAHMQHETLDQQTRVFGDQALFWGHSRIRGEYKGKQMDLLSNETLLMHRVDGQWRIRHIHWSSRNAS